MEKTCYSTEVLNKCQKYFACYLIRKQFVCALQLILKHSYANRLGIVIIINVSNKQWTPNEGLSEATFAKSIKQIERVSHLVSQSVSQSVLAQC